MRIGMRSAVGLTLASAVLAAVMTTAPNEARAETEVSVRGKGIAGGAMIGAEIGVLALSAGHAKSAWMYIALPGALAAGGAVGGYYLENASRDAGSPGIPMLVLGLGLGLVIPTVILAIDANAYHAETDELSPTDGGTVSTGGSVEVSGSAGGSGGATTTPSKPVKRRLQQSSLYRPGALVNFDDMRSTLSIGMPSMQLVPTYTLAERVQFGVPQRYEVRAPIFSVAF
jgi:hypothetical protein